MASAGDEIMSDGMPFFHTDGARIVYRDDGPRDAPSLLCVHGSWDDHHSWDGFAALLPQMRIVRYDRRGHSLSSAPPGQGRLGEDVADAVALLDHLQIARAHIVGHSYGANVAIMIATRHPDRAETLMLHEPPVFALLSGDATADALRAQAAGLMARAAEAIEQGRVEQGARLFLEQVAFGEGSWTDLFDAETRATLLRNAGTWLDQYRDPERLAVDVRALCGFPRAIALSTGRATLPAYAEVIRRIAGIVPNVTVHPIERAGHGAHISHPAEMAQEFLTHIASGGA